MFFVYSVCAIYLAEFISGGYAFLAFLVVLGIHAAVKPETPTGKAGKWILGLIALFGFASALFGVFKGGNSD